MQYICACFCTCLFVSIYFTAYSVRLISIKTCAKTTFPTLVSAGLAVIVLTGL